MNRVVSPTGMTPLRRPAGAYIHGHDGPLAAVPGWGLAWLESHTNLNAQRVALRGQHPEVDELLAALHSVATQWSVMTTSSAPSSDLGTTHPVMVEPAGELVVERIDVNTAAEVIGITTRAVRKAIAEQRLLARRDGSRWSIDRNDARQYRAAAQATRRNR